MSSSEWRQRHLTARAQAARILRSAGRLPRTISLFVALWMTLRRVLPLRAERGMGEALAETPKAKGGAGDPKRSQHATTSTPKLADIDLSRSG